MSIHSSSLKEFSSKLAALGEKPFRARQIFQWVYEKKVSCWDQMTDLSLSLREKLKENIQLSSLEVVRKETSQDEQTIKFLFKLSDGKLIESVLIYSGDRRTVCVSSQVGCNARCAFCASGKQGWMRNLSTAEIVEQVYWIDQFLSESSERVSHIVFMGMGEPFDNYESVVGAIRWLNDPERLGISQRKMTVSTVGVVEGMERFTEEGLSVSMVLSLHAPNQHVRKKIIPYARKYPIEDVLAAMTKYSIKTRRDVTYEYILIDGINAEIEHAHELVDLLKKHRGTVNLIPYNPVAGLSLRRPSKEKIEAFQEVLEKGRVNTTRRYTKGKDIAAACGQLALQKPEDVLYAF